MHASSRTLQILSSNTVVRLLIALSHLPFNSQLLFELQSLRTRATDTQDTNFKKMQQPYEQVEWGWIKYINTLDVQAGWYAYQQARGG